MADAHWTGRVIDGRYVVEATLGHGGMGVVLRARHRFTNAQVALKMLQPDLVTNADAQDRFLAEARAPSAIGHPGIVQILDAGKTPEGELYLAMELLSGRTLRHAMAPAMPPQVVRRILLELLDALGAAHTRGIVHRDLKPENVFLAGDAGTVKLLDFGIAKVVQAATRAGATAAGALLGTLAYMAPEQLSDASSVDERADLWAVGVMLYEMLSGQLPYRGAALGELMMALATQDPDPIAAYMPATPAISAFFERALARDRGRRFASAHEMALAVSALALDGTQPHAVAADPHGTVATAGGPPKPLVPAGAPAFAGPHVPPPMTPAPVPAGSAVPNRGPSAPLAAVPNRGRSAPPPVAMPSSAASGPGGAMPVVAGAVRSARPRTPTSPPPPGPVAAAPAKSSAWMWIVIGVAAFVTMVIIIGILVTAPDPAGNPRAADTPPATPQERCERGCAMLAGCTIAQDGCVAECLGAPVMQDCLGRGSCEGYATCMHGRACNQVEPSGTASCADTARCELACNGELSCICGTCLPRLSPRHSIALYRVHLCARAQCATEGIECTLDRCQAPLAQCSAE